MALSVKSVKALEMAKHALSMLYATDYFTDDEWTRLDALIHKGKYVWTTGPPTLDLLDGSPLLMAADNKYNEPSVTQSEIFEPLDMSTHSITSQHEIPRQQPTPPYSPADDLGSGIITRSIPDSELLVDYSSHSASTTQPTTPRQSTRSPALSVKAASKTPDPLTQANLSTVPQSKPKIEELTAAFIEKHGREPRSIADIYQPNNPEHWSHKFKSPSVTSPKTFKSSTAPSLSGSARQSVAGPLLQVPANSILIAQKGYESNSKLKMSVKPGDNIQYIKFVSGSMHVGLNLRTNEHAQVAEDIFKNRDGQFIDALFNLPQPKTKGGKRGRKVSMSSADLRAGIDNMVEQNAAEWNAVTDDEDESIFSPTQQGESFVTSLRDNVKSDWSEEMNAFANRQELGPDMMKAVVDGVSQVFEEKFQKYLRDRAGPNNIAPPRQNRSVTKPISVATATATNPPKTATCWMWKHKTCRFRDEECHDLHADSDVPPVLINGRPGWGDLASSMHAGPSDIKSGPNYQKSLTCHFWANGLCDKTDDECKFLHSNDSKGVAFRPGHFNKGKWASKIDSNEWKTDTTEKYAASTWRTKSVTSKDSEGPIDNKMYAVLDYEDDHSHSILSPTAEVYKPPHVKALERQVRVDSIPSESAPEPSVIVEPTYVEQLQEASQAAPQAAPQKSTEVAPISEHTSNTITESGQYRDPDNPQIFLQPGDEDLDLNAYW